MRSSEKLGWRQGYLNIFNKVRRGDNFIRTIEQIKTTPSKSRELLADLFAEHKIPANLYAFVSNYAHTGQEDYSLIQPSIQIVSDFDETAHPYADPKIGYQLYIQSKLLGDKEIKIVLDPESNIDEIIETLHFYRKEIESMRMSAINATKLTPRRRRARKIDRDTLIKQLYDEGMKPRQIAKYLDDKNDNSDNLTGPDISKIINKMK